MLWLFDCQRTFVHDVLSIKLVHDVLNVVTYSNRLDQAGPDSPPFDGVKPL